METLQQFFTQWVSSLADLLPVGYAFGAGMVSAVNPCGFAMLPAYLGLYLGARDMMVAPSGTTVVATGIASAGAIPAQVARATVVTWSVTAGFVLLFGGVGLAISAGGRIIIDAVPWVALGIGVILVILGVGMLRGRRLSANFAARIADRLGDPTEVGMRGFFIFGVTYATASLSCTLPIFLTVVGGSLAVSGFASAALQFVSYALGMGLIILMLTMSLALFKGSLIGGVRRVLPYVERVSAVLMIVAGTYIVYYWLIKGRLIERFV